MDDLFFHDALYLADDRIGEAVTDGFGPQHSDTLCPQEI